MDLRDRFEGDPECIFFTLFSLLWWKDILTVVKCQLSNLELMSYFDSWVTFYHFPPSFENQSNDSDAVQIQTVMGKYNVTKSK